MNSGLVIVLAAFAAAAAPDRLPPIEQCGDDPSFAGFREQLLVVIARKDRAALMPLLDKGIVVDFGGGEGHDAFSERWKLDAAESPLWAELGAALRYGCARSGDALVTPSLVEQFGTQYDVINTVVGMPGSDLRGAPNDLAPIIATLDWNVVTVTDTPKVAGWSNVTMSDGRSGYVRDGRLRSPLDYRAVFEKRDNRWLMTALVAGD